MHFLGVASEAASSKPTVQEGHLPAETPKTTQGAAGAAGAAPVQNPGDLGFP